MIKVVLVEDDIKLADTLARALSKSEDMEVLGVYYSAESALAANPWKTLDVLLVDLELPGMPGHELIEHVLKLAPELICVVNTIHEDQQSVFDALKAGASAYLLKGCSVLDLRAAIRSAAAGESPMSPSIARRLLDQFRTAQDELLSAREEMIVQQLSNGLSYKETAVELGISTHTVHSHIKKIYQKLQVNSRAQAVRRARAIGYIKE